MTGEQPDAEAPEAAFASFFKALSNTERLRVAGAIAAGPRTVGDIAAALALPYRSTRGHLEALVDAGFATVDGQGADARYAWNEKRVRALAKAHLDSPRVREMAGARDERSRVLAAFIRDGRLIGWPAGEARKQILLEHIADRFESGRVYSEREVNAILKPLADDYTTIRRALVDRAFLNRQDNVYWVGEGRRQADTGGQVTPAGSGDAAPVSRPSDLATLMNLREQDASLRRE
jgi:hypothetical protein